MTTTCITTVGFVRWTHRVAVVLLMLVGGSLLAQATWIDVKAWLAQRLLERAWRKTQDGERDAKPWPWADTHPLARLRLVDHDGVSLIVLTGASGRTLAFAPGHIDGTALPGSSGNVGIAGHRDTHFRVLRDVRRGDLVELETPVGERLTYRVTSTEIVDQRDTRLLHHGSDRLTLVTCYPFDAIRPGGPLRWLVTAERHTSRFEE